MIIISLGSNVISRWGNSNTTILQALRELETRGIQIVRHSRLYRTSPFGLVDQPIFTNSAAMIRTSLPPRALLSVAKKIEAEAGRSPSRAWGPRELDIDIIDYNSQILNWSQRDTQSFKCNRFRVILPHPRIEMRAFVLQPLLDIAPHWHHPVSGLHAGQMLARLRFLRMGRIIDALADNTL
jgi:2-amino-4-hydroxy-6-hydroxymethyldihydropteridine diphosphokinase